MLVTLARRLIYVPRWSSPLSGVLNRTLALQDAVKVLHPFSPTG